MEYKLGRYKFESKQQAKIAIREILYRVGTDVCLCGIDYELVYALLLLHPTAKDKIGSGVHSITITESLHGSRCFNVHRTDGTSIDFSYLGCFDGSTHISCVSRAARKLIDDQISQFKLLALSTLDSTTTRNKRYHVHHLAPSFDTLLRDWLDYHNITFNDIRLIEDTDGIGDRFESTELSVLFKAYHRAYAKLELVTIAEHASIHKNMTKCQ